MGAGHSTPAADARASAARAPGRDEDSRVEIGSEWITIRRDICGIAARVNVPTQSYRGITLRARRDGRPFELALAHMDSNLEVVIARTDDDSDLIALWRSYGRMLSLPLLAEDERGRLQAIELQGDRPPFPRRHGSPLKNRRPRFLARRRVGRADTSGAASAA